MLKINLINPEKWKEIIALSNENAMKKSHKYPLFEKPYFISCLDYTETLCGTNCFCRSISNKGVWVVKPDLQFSVFLEFYAKLWVRGSKSLINKVNDPNLVATGREKNSVIVLRSIKARWNNWDGKGNSLPKLASSYKCTYLCDDSFKQVEGIVNKIREVCAADSTGVYTSKLISQIFPDLAIPFDTASKLKMHNNGYNPLLYGNGVMKLHVKNFIIQNGLSMSDFRILDNAPRGIWALHSLHGEPTTCSRVIDKLFY